jgi:hypothetical protein
MNNSYDEKMCINEINHFIDRFEANLENTIYLRDWTRERIYSCLIYYFRWKKIEIDQINSLNDDRGWHNFYEDKYQVIIKIALMVYQNQDQFDLDEEFKVALEKTVNNLLLPDMVEED